MHSDIDNSYACFGGLLFLALMRTQLTLVHLGELELINIDEEKEMFVHKSYMTTRLPTIICKFFIIFLRLMFRVPAEECFQLVSVLIKESSSTFFNSILLIYMHHGGGAST